jgi:hypothetical protein
VRPHPQAQSLRIRGVVNRRLPIIISPSLYPRCDGVIRTKNSFVALIAIFTKGHLKKTISSAIGPLEPFVPPYAKYTFIMIVFPVR